jgi:hypothetical protein
MGNLIDDIIVLLIFIYFALLINDVIKMKVETREKFDSIIRFGKNKTIYKIIIYIGVVVFAIIATIDIANKK